ncbi:hypothetical protein ACJZ2D_000950 [Fusarium nematophilum]
MRVEIASIVAAAVLVHATPLSGILEARQDENVPVEDVTVSAEQDLPNYEGWRDVACDAGSLGDVSNDPFNQWQDSKAVYAFMDFIDAWKAQEGDPNRLSLPNFLGNFFKAKPRLDCQHLETDNCNTFINCGQADAANAAVNSPAGYFLINSMIMAHNAMDLIVKGLRNGHGSIDGSAGDFATAFSPVKADIIKAAKNLVESKRILDGIQLGFAFVSSFAFNSWFKKVPAFRNNPNNLGTAKDDINALVAFGINYQKDGMSSGANSIISIDNQISTMFTNMTDTWITATSKMAEGIFTDWTKLYQLIVNGKCWAPDVGDSPLEVTGLVKKIIYSSVIPSLWTVGPDNHMPFIATSEGLSQDGTGCESWKPESGLSESLKTRVDVKKDAFDGARVCDGDEAFFMVAIGQSSDCPFGQTYPCTNHLPAVKRVQGADELMRGQYSLTYEEMVRKYVYAISTYWWIQKTNSSAL